MLFDPTPAELPVATLRARGSTTRIAMELRAWLVARWRWFRPRTIPVLVAVAGLCAVLASSNYLSELATETPERLDAPTAAPTPAMAHLEDIELAPAAEAPAIRLPYVAP
ncbi:MAG: hypothetical protein ACTHU0_04060 [Kofleriaceae bacterium]